MSQPLQVSSSPPLRVSIKPLLRLADELNLTGLQEALDLQALAEFWAGFLTPDRLRYLLKLQNARHALNHLRNEPLNDETWVWLDRYDFKKLTISLPSEDHCLQVLKDWRLPTDGPFVHRLWWDADASAIVVLDRDDPLPRHAPRLHIGYDRPRQVPSSEFIVKCRLDKWDKRVGQLIWNPDGKFSPNENHDLEIVELKIPRSSFDADLNGRTIKQAMFEKLWNTALYGGKGRTGEDPCFPAHITIIDPPV